uniref:ULP_PROTEASE domain-containing protein n=1 Tax=Strongyloides stercoralis TaxID=6248 RepID=A0A0K0E4W1_STRER
MARNRSLKKSNSFREEIKKSIDKLTDSGFFKVEKNNESVNNSDSVYTSIFIFKSFIVGSLPTEPFCVSVFVEYIEACCSSLRNKYPDKEFYCDRSKIKKIEIKDMHQQNNNHDCGLFLIEFIRQIMINPKSLENLILGLSSKDVFPDFSVSLKRDLLKYYMYSKANVKKWRMLYELENFYVKNFSKEKNKKNTLRIS